MFQFARLPFTLFAYSAYVAVLAGSLVATAQSVTTAVLNGTVHDMSGAVVPNTTVTASDATKGVTRSVTTDGTGKYEFLQLPPGTYTIVAVSPSFSKLVRITWF